jgi:hypothetical protein
MTTKRLEPDDVKDIIIFSPDHAPQRYLLPVEDFDEWIGELYRGYTNDDYKPWWIETHEYKRIRDLKMHEKPPVVDDGLMDRIITQAYDDYQRQEESDLYEMFQAAIVRELSE